VNYAVIGPTYPYRGGISHYTTLLVEHLRKKHDVKLYSYVRQYPGFLFPGETDKDPSQLVLRTDCEYLVDPINPLTWLEVFWRIRRYHPDALILQWWVPYWTPTLATISFLVKALTSIKILYICHDIAPPDGGGPFDRYLARFVLRRGDSFIVHSRDNLEKLNRMLSRDDVHVTVHPSYDMFNDGHPRSRAEAQARLGVQGNTILFFGFVRLYKGLEYLLKALPEVAKRLDVQLLVAGEFWIPESYYREFIDDESIADRVKIVNRYIPNEEVPDYFAAADVVICPYVAGSQSGAVQLAYGFGKPVIVTDAGGIADVVKDGKTGLVVPPRDSPALAEAIVRYFEDGLADKFAREIQKEEQKSLFAWETLVELIERLSVA
jgi:glycosyltransferase involved in cell wall biosynthesis